jgi:segregation and condensation protein A
MFSPQELRLAALRALETRPVVHVQTDHVLVDEVTVSDVVEALCAILPSSGPTTFKALTANARSRMEVVVHFLGLLELYKRGFVELDQATTFGELRVSWSAPGSEALIRSGDGDSLRSDGSVPQVPVMSLAELEYRG